MKNGTRDFESKDIGGELLPVITKGLYPDHRDALREYIQNAIDANASKVRIVILGSSIIIEDDGDGMTVKEAQSAIRIGLSDKDPNMQVGFRGVGIYSSYDLSSELHILTSPRNGSKPSKISFFWDAIKGELRKEHIDRLAGNPSRLSLEGLLKGRVFVTDVAPDVSLPKPHGTKVIISGLDPQLMKSISDKERTTQYLRDAVSLPFSPDFEQGEEISKWLSEAGIKTIRVVVKINGNETEIFRPYDSTIFSTKRDVEILRFTLHDKYSRKNQGFAWICFNNANEYLPRIEVRGVLLKKMGFSIGTRGRLEPLFSRVVFSRRCTGEAIITNPQLLPNAARTDFEPGPEKDSLDRALANLVIQISKEGAILQNIYKAIEWLENSLSTIAQINEKISKGKISQDDLITYTPKVEELLNDLRRYRKTALIADKTKFEKVTGGLDGLKTALSELNRKARKGSVDAVQREIKAAQKRAIVTPTTQVPKQSIFDVAKSAAPKSVDETLSWIEFLDNKFFLLIDEADYNEVLESFKELLEGTPKE